MLLLPLEVVSEAASEAKNGFLLSLDCTVLRRKTAARALQSHVEKAAAVTATHLLKSANSALELARPTSNQPQPIAASTQGPASLDVWTSPGLERT